MKNILCYMLSSVFLLAILSSCEVEDNEPRLSDLAGNTYIGNSELDLNIGKDRLPATSDEKSDGAIIEYIDAATDNLIITLTDAQVTLILAPSPVDVDAVFTLTVDSLKENEEDDGAIRFVLANTGSLDLTVGKGSGALSIENLVLRDVNATRATDEGIELTGTVNLTGGQPDALLNNLNPDASSISQNFDVEITLRVSSIAEGELPDPPADPALADLAGDYTGESNLVLGVPPAIEISPVGTNNRANVVFKDAGTDNLVITLTNNALFIAGSAVVDIDGDFTFTISNLVIENNDIEFDIGDGGSVADLTFDSQRGSRTIPSLTLSNVDATLAGASVITLTATVTLTEEQANELLLDVRAGVTVPAGGGDVEVDISLSVDNITEDDS